MSALAIACVLVATAAPVASDTVRIEWNAPASCPSPASIDESLRAALRRPPTEPIAVRADVVLDARGFVADVVVDTTWGASRRHIEADDCTSIADTTLLIAVIAADPLAIAMGEPPPVIRPQTPAPIVVEPAIAPFLAEPTPPVVEPVVTRPVVDDAPVSLRARARRPHGVVRIDGAFGIGMVPRSSGAIGGAIGVQWRHAELGVSALWWPPRSTRANVSGASARIGLVGVGPYGCGFLGPRAWSIGLCGSFELGVMTGRGRDVRGAARETRPWLGLTAGPRLRWSPHPRVGLVAGLDGVAVAYRPHFVVENEGDLYRSGIAAFRARLGIEVRWP